MSNSISKMVLSVAKEREKERIEGLTKTFLAAVDSIFQEESSNFNLIMPNHDYFLKNINISYKDLKEICDNLGFTLFSSIGSISISIPEWCGAKKRTYAQLMLFHYNLQMKRLIKEEKVTAKKICEEIIQKLLHKDFSSQKRFKSFLITVKSNTHSKTKVCENEVSRIMLSKYHIELTGEDQIWNFCVE